MATQCTISLLQLKSLSDADGAVSFHRDKNDCKRYFVCQGEHEHHKSCPDGLVFNEDEGVCDWPYLLHSVFVSQKRAFT